VRIPERPGLPVFVVTTLVALAAVTLVEWQHRRHDRATTVARLAEALEGLCGDATPLLLRSSAEADAIIREWAAAGGFRVTLVAADGRVHADSWTLPSLLDRLENHAQRQEIVLAAGGGFGVAHRRSLTSDRFTTYVAKLTRTGDRSSGTLRLSVEDTPRVFSWSAVMMALLGAAMAGALAQTLGRRFHEQVARHLVPWTDLPGDAALAAQAEKADRLFRATQERLAHEANVTRAAVDEVGEGVALVDTAGVVRFANAAATRLIGDDLRIGRPLVEGIRAPELLAALHDVLERGGARHTSCVGATGVELVVRVCALDHPILAVAVVWRDISGERQLERARRALVADLAHELRTPLTVLAGVSEELAEEGIAADVLATLERQVRRLRTFAEDLEELAAIESGQLQLHDEELDASAIARQVAGDLAGEAERAGVAVSVSGGPVTLRTDPSRLFQVLTNLVDNGIRYNRQGGMVEVVVERMDSGARIVVRDSGVGIPAVEVGLVFQRFYRVRRGSQSEGGSGLGLAIVKHLVGALGGTVHLASEEGKGTVVTVELLSRA
jgi:two-component system phosphate regulon sensor histidine kinase PhoR